MSSDVLNIAELREHLMEKATVDDDFRTELLADPKAAIKAELGIDIPEGFEIKVHEEAADTGHLVLPPSAAQE